MCNCSGLILRLSQIITSEHVEHSRSGHDKWGEISRGRLSLDGMMGVSNMFESFIEYVWWKKEAKGNEQEEECVKDVRNTRSATSFSFWELTLEIHWLSDEKEEQNIDSRSCLNYCILCILMVQTQNQYLVASLLWEVVMSAAANERSERRPHFQIKLQFWSASFLAVCIWKLK